MLTRHLEGALLDYWVARAQGLSATIHNNACYTGMQAVTVKKIEGWVPHYSPTTNWASGGPIIDDADMNLIRYDAKRRQAEFWIDYPDGSAKCFAASGPTNLIAAMRAKVLSVFGETVEDIPEL